jgi:2-keto-4-pentenoate hydratase/2-oxohepta-3-ene-1,7-dioic acid hydratase in catechol pathway
MRIAAYFWGGQRQVGVVSADGATVMPLALPRQQAEKGVLAVIQLLADGQPMPGAGGPSLPTQVVQLDAPIPLPRRNVFCVGRNYHEHAKELQTSVFKDNDANPESWPIIFTKVPESVIGPFDDVRIPSEVSTQIDYEAELCIVIGKGGRNISRAEALGHVYGYTVVNDVTARDVQIRHQQWDLGKSFDTFCPMGPWIVTADELDGTKTRVRCYVNGELRQDGPVENMIFDIPTLIETCSRGITLYPGDLIATGTPAGVGMGMKPPRWLKPGDVVRVEIDGLGFIENKFV